MGGREQEWVPRGHEDRLSQQCGNSIPINTSCLRRALPQIGAIALALFFSYCEGMEVEFTPDLQARLRERASQQGVNLNEVVLEVVSRFFAEEDRFVEAVRRGEAALERGDVLTHQQVADRLRRFLQP